MIGRLSASSKACCRRELPAWGSIYEIVSRYPLESGHAICANHMITLESGHGAALSYGLASTMLAYMLNSETMDGSLGLEAARLGRLGQYLGYACVCTREGIGNLDAFKK